MNSFTAAASVSARGFRLGGVIRRRDPVGGDEGKAGEVEVRGEHQPFQAGGGRGGRSDHDDAPIRGDFGLRQEAPGQEVERGRLCSRICFFFVTCLTEFKRGQWWWEGLLLVWCLYGTRYCLKLRT